MNLNPTIRLARQLAEAVRVRQALITGGAKLTDFPVMQLDRKMTVLAADLEAAIAEPQPVAPWTPWSSRNSLRTVGVEL